MDTVKGKKLLFHNTWTFATCVFCLCGCPSLKTTLMMTPCWIKFFGALSSPETKERKKKKDILAHAISSLPDLVGWKSLFFQASEQQSKSSWNRPCNTWRTNTGDAEHVCSAQGTCWDDGHVICALGMMSAVRRKGNKVLGAHNKGLLKVCLLAVVRPKGSVCMVSSNQVPQRICYEDHLKQITTREAE